MLIFDQLRKNDPYLRTITSSVLVGMLVLLAGLYYVQVISARHYEENQISQAFRTVRIPAVRGKILDRNGVALAENQPSYSAGIYLEELRNLFKEEWKRSKPPLVTTHQSFTLFGFKLFQWSKTRPAYRLSSKERADLESLVRYKVVTNIARQVEAVLRQPVPVDFRQFTRHYSQQLSLPFPLVKDLNANLVARFEEHPIQAPGVDLEIQPYRHYPYGSVAAHLLGYLTRDDSSAKDEDAFFNYRLPDYRGRVGIERTFDEELRGKAGVKSVLVNSMGYRQSETIWTPAEPGKNVVLTIDLDLQRATEEALKAAHPPTRGAAVVMDPWSGDVLAMASAPTFDPNLFIPQIAPEDYERLLDPEARPQINRAVQENYAPGSIFKIVTGLACLERGLDPEVSFYNPGHIYVGRRYINDLAKPGFYNFRRGFLKSSNFYFITNGMAAGVDKIVELGERLFLGERTGLPTAQEVPGYFPNSKKVHLGWTAGDTANLCIGQGTIDVTPLQMAVMTSAIANGGKVMWPRLVDRVEPADPHGEEEPVSFPAGRVRGELGVQPKTLQIVREAMLGDVEDDEGTGRRAGEYVPGLRICGKTGTAQVTNFKNQVTGQITWFTSFAPYENPRYVVVVMVEDGASGGATCAPVASKIYKALLDQESPPDAAVAQLR
jgi:penicillin-binding protein 2